MDMEVEQEKVFRCDEGAVSEGSTEYMACSALMENTTCSAKISLHISL